MNYNYNYNYGYNLASDTIFTGILAIYFVVLVVFLIFYVISYIFKGIGMYTIAKRQGKDYPWLAFIPFARAYLHGDLAGSITLKTKKINSPGVWVLVIPFIIGAIDFIFLILFWIVGIGAFASAIGSSVAESVYGYESSGLSTGGITGLLVVAVIWMIVLFVFQAVYKALLVLVNHQILERFTTKNMSIAHAVLSIFIPLYESICLFVMRNRDFNQGMEPDLGRPFIQTPPLMPPTGGPAGEPYNTAAPHGQQIPPIEPSAPVNPAEPPKETETPVKPQAPADNIVYADPPKNQEPPQKPAAEAQEKPSEEPPAE